MYNAYKVQIYMKSKLKEVSIASSSLLLYSSLSPKGSHFYYFMIYLILSTKVNTCLSVLFEGLSCLVFLRQGIAM
jgi:hypothetical protein